MQSDYRADRRWWAAHIVGAAMPAACPMTSTVKGIDVPPVSRIARELAGADFFDCHEILLAHDGRPALEIYLEVIARTPSWVNFLMASRNRIASLLGLKDVGHLGGLDNAKPASAYLVGDRVGIFSLLFVTDDEAILGEFDMHLDVKVSICRLRREGRESVAVTTVVHIHNFLGRTYMLLVLPFHRFIVPVVLGRVVEVGGDA
jgi:hypothetical protein